MILIKAIIIKPDDLTLGFAAGLDAEGYDPKDGICYKITCEGALPQRLPAAMEALAVYGEEGAPHMGASLIRLFDDISFYTGGSIFECIRELLHEIGINPDLVEVTVDGSRKMGVLHERCIHIDARSYQQGERQFFAARPCDVARLGKEIRSRWVWSCFLLPWGDR
jgi:hypothetical protein